MIDDYIKLTANEVIREGDSAKWRGAKDFSAWGAASTWIGQKVKDNPNWEFRRHRASIIRDAAKALLAVIESRLAVKGSYKLIEPEAQALREALGLTIEELSGEG